MSLVRSSASLQDKIKTLNSLKEKLKNLDTADKFKGTIVERWGLYWKGLYKDYKDAAVDVVTECKERPIKSAIYCLGLAGGYFCIKNNPDECTYREDLLRSEMKLWQVSELTRNPTSVNHVSYMKECMNMDVLRRFSLGLFSIMWIDDSNSKCSNYKYTCKYLKPQISDFHKRIVDIGFINKWWILDNKMIDYDVNYNEFNDK